MYRDLKGRYQNPETKLLLQMVAFLDPRLRKMDFIEEVERKKVKLEIKKMMVSLSDQLSKVVVKSEPGEKPQLPGISMAPYSSSDLTTEPDVSTTEPPAKKVQVEKSFFEDFFYFKLSSQKLSLRLANRQG